LDLVKPPNIDISEPVKVTVKPSELRNADEWKLDPPSDNNFRFDEASKPKASLDEEEPQDENPIVEFDADADADDRI